MIIFCFVFSVQFQMALKRLSTDLNFWYKNAEDFKREFSSHANSNYIGDEVGLQLRKVFIILLLFLFWITHPTRLLGTLSKRNAYQLFVYIFWNIFFLFFQELNDICVAVERFIELSHLIEANENAIKLAYTSFEFSLARGMY